LIYEAKPQYLSDGVVLTYRLFSRPLLNHAVQHEESIPIFGGVGRKFRLDFK
jgi:hypothetical protein